MIYSQLFNNFLYNDEQRGEGNASGADFQGRFRLGDSSWNEKEGVIPILPPMIDAVARLPLPCTPRYMSARFKRACVRAGLADFRFHDLRHTMASLLINAGHSLKVVQEVLGHRSVQSANRYAHLSVTSKRAALASVFGGNQGAPQGNNFHARQSMR